MTLTLDVACGTKPKGNINCDLFKGFTPHIGQSTSPFIDPKKIPNFIQSDIHHLPFKKNTFDKTFCCHVLEHKGVHPIKAIKEMVRVTNGEIHIAVPHRFAEGKARNNPCCKRVHDKAFNMTNLMQIFEKLGLVYDIKLNYHSFPHPFFPLLRLPYEIVVTVFARAKKLGEF